MDDVKLDELRLLFDRENSRKQSLENKASYFLGCISIIMTLICTFSNSITLDNLAQSKIVMMQLRFFNYCSDF